MLQRDRGEGDEALRVRGACLGELLVLDLDDLPGEVAVRLVPARIAWRKSLRVVIGASVLR
jgi:hypothetical protein